jgi:hypothetical protein
LDDTLVSGGVVEDALEDRLGLLAILGRDDDEARLAIDRQQRLVYRDLLFGEAAPDAGEVLLADCARLELFLDVGRRLGVERHEHEAAREPVKPVNGCASD